MAVVSTSISGGEISSLIVAVTGVGYFLVNVLRKPKDTADPNVLKRLADCLQTKGAQAIELQQLREYKRSQMRKR